jgi:hypothetical protein
MTDPLKRVEVIRHEVIAHHDAGVKGSLLAEYRCRAKGCVLLQVWQTSNGPEFLAPGNRLSPQNMPRSAGPWDWAGRLDDYPETLWMPLWCDHVKDHTYASEVRRDCADRTPGRPRRVSWPRDTRDHLVP